jgi:hypothetical protein
MGGFDATSYQLGNPLQLFVESLYVAALDYQTIYGIKGAGHTFIHSSIAAFTSALPRT